jgi:hypothetical protein
MLHIFYQYLYNIYYIICFFRISLYNLIFLSLKQSCRLAISEYFFVFWTKEEFGFLNGFTFFFDRVKTSITKCPVMVLLKESNEDEEDEDTIRFFMKSSTPGEILLRWILPSINGRNPTLLRCN